MFGWLVGWLVGWLFGWLGTYDHHGFEPLTCHGSPSSKLGEGGPRIHSLRRKVKVKHWIGAKQQINCSELYSLRNMCIPYKSTSKNQVKQHNNIKIHSGKLTWQWKLLFTLGKTSSNGPFSIAMLVYRSLMFEN